MHLARAGRLLPECLAGRFARGKFGRARMRRADGGLPARDSHRGFGRTIGPAALALFAHYGVETVEVVRPDSD